MLADALTAAHTHHTAGQWQAAIPLYQQALAQNPADIGAWVGLALCHEELGNIPAARQALLACLAQRPQTAFAETKGHPLSCPGWVDSG